MLPRRALAVLALLGALSCRPAAAPAPPERVEVYRVFEVRAQAQVAEGGAEVRGVLQEPGGGKREVPGFVEGGVAAVRFSAIVPGEHRYELFVDGQRLRAGAFVATARPDHGFVRRDPRRPHGLAHEDGTPFFVLGENRINVYDPAWNYQNLGIEPYVAQMAAHGMTTLRFFVFTDCENEAGGKQLGCLEPERGRFDPQVAAEFDRVFAAAERHDVYVILAPWAIGFTGGAETWRSWADNPWSSARGGPARDASEFFTREDTRRGAEKKLRYVLARWGWSKHLLAIDLLNEPEWDGPIAEKTWVPWAEAMARYQRRVDGYGHLVTAGPVGLRWNVGEGDERPWYASPQNDLVQWHLYGADYYDPPALAAEMTRRIEETWGFDKPVFCGEFGYGGEDPQTHEHTHAGIWSALMSGAGALSHTAPQFQIDSDEPMTPERARHFLALRDFLRRLDWSRDLTPARDLGAGAWSLRAADGRYRAMWLLGARPTVTVPDLPAGVYSVEWWDDVSGASLGQQTVASAGGAAVLPLPPFGAHVAGRLQEATR